MDINRLNKPHEIDVLLANKVAEYIQEKPDINLGLATGSTYIGFYQTCVDLLKNKKMDVRSLKTFNLDRYYNQSIEDDSSFEAFMHQYFFDPLKIHEDQIHFPYFQNDEDYGRYDTIIEMAGGLDVILLGIGVNAHIAFNEPGTPFTSKTHKIELAPSTIDSNKEFFNGHESIPKEAVTMGISTILNAKKIILVAKGENKAQAIHDMIHAPISESVPATALRLHENVEVYVDKEAGSLI